MMGSFVIKSICAYIFICAVFIILPFYSFKILGYGVTSSISIFINGAPLVFIYSPENITYFFSIGSNYTLPLDVSTGNTDVDTWWYKLEDLRHDRVVYEKVVFNPNFTFDATRWSNRLTVFVNSTRGDIGNASVVFFITVPNSPPVLDNISYQLYACEDLAFIHSFNVTDVDEDELTLNLYPKNPFFVYPAYFDNHNPPVTSAIISSALSKAQIGEYNETLYVTDGVLSDYKNFLVNVLEINHKPSITNPGVQTIWDKGDNNNLYLDFWTSDVEDGNETGGNLTYTLSFNNGPSLFNIGSTTGIINWTANPVYDGIYNLTVCARDLGLARPHPNISLCNSSGVNAYGCVNFSLTVTNENRPPYFVSYEPLIRNLTIKAGEYLQFNVTVRDPDGTIPDIYWYVDSAKRKNVTSGSLNDTFNYTFECSEGGYHEIKSEITDGLLNASTNWSIFVSIIGCPTLLPGGGGGSTSGGGAGEAARACENKWVCQDWSVCQNLEFSYLAGNISEKDYSDLEVMCSIFDLGKGDCGFQVRECKDLNTCRALGNKPLEIQACFYSQYPNCKDGIKNCHGGGCELLTDCGGPCPPCPTCSDGIQNQGESGIDCGGPCPFTCEAKEKREKIKFNYALILITLLILIVVIIIIMKVMQIIKTRKESRNLQWYKLK